MPWDTWDWSKKIKLFIEKAYFRHLNRYYNVYANDIEITIFNYFESFSGLTQFFLNG